MKLENKVAIVTGGATGIGKAIARGFAKEGANIVISSRGVSADPEHVVKEIESLGRKILAIKCDVGIKKQVEEMVRKTMDAFGKIDILVNNAGTMPQTPFFEISEEELNIVINTILKGTFFCSQAVAKEMIKRRSGKIINISSGQAHVGTTVMSHYSAAKGGVNSLTRDMATELGPYGINVNTISCGLSTSEFILKNVPPKVFEIYKNHSALGRLGTPEDYVGIAVYLASDESSFITGQIILVDGGFTISKRLRP